MIKTINAGSVVDVFSEDVIIFFDGSRKFISRVWYENKIFFILFREDSERIRLHYDLRGKLILPEGAVEIRRML